MVLQGQQALYTYGARNEAPACMVKVGFSKPICKEEDCLTQCCSHVLVTL